MTHDRGSKVLEHRALEGLSEEVGKHLVCWTIFNLNVTTVDSVFHKEKPYVNVS